MMNLLNLEEDDLVNELENFIERILISNYLKGRGDDLDTKSKNNVISLAEDDVCSLAVELN